MQTSSNSSKRLIRVLRGMAVVAGAALLASWLWQVVSDAGHAAASGAPVRPDEVLAALVAAAALAGVVWLALGVLLELVSLVPGAVGHAACQVADLVTPRLLRRAAGTLLGVGLAAGALPGASVAAPVIAVHAAPAPLPDPGFAPLPDPGWAPPAVPRPASAGEPVAPAESGVVPPALSGVPPPPLSGVPPSENEPTASGRGWVPSPPAVRAQPDVRVLSPAPPPGTTRGGPAEVVVRRGDSLWTIAARHLGPDVSDGEIARAWPAWFEANRTVIGDDPDLLRPGQVLRAPEVVQP